MDPPELLIRKRQIINRIRHLPNTGFPRTESTERLFFRIAAVFRDRCENRCGQFAALFTHPDCGIGFSALLHIFPHCRDFQLFGTFQTKRLFPFRPALLFQDKHRSILYAALFA